MMWIVGCGGVWLVWLVWMAWVWYRHLRASASEEERAHAHQARRTGRGPDGARRMGVWVWIALAGSLAASASPAGAQPIEQIARAEVGVREATGRNDGDRVETYLAACGLGAGHPWCAAFVAWCHLQSGRPVPRGAAWSPAWFTPERTVWRRGPGGEPAWRAGDVFGVWYARLGRIGHVGLVDTCDGEWVITVEGNTNAGGRREGQGVHRRRRSRKAIHAVSRWEAR